MKANTIVATVPALKALASPSQDDTAWVQSTAKGYYYYASATAGDYAPDVGSGWWVYDPIITEVDIVIIPNSRFATHADVQNPEAEVEIDDMVSAGTKIKIYYDREYPIEPLVTHVEVDEIGANVTQVKVKKGYVELRFDIPINSGRKVKIKTKPRFQVT